MKIRRGKGLGGKPPRRGGRLTRESREGAEKGRPRALLGVLAAALFVVGGVLGFAWALDRTVRGGVLQQRVEAASRPDWVQLEELPRYVPEAFLAVAQPSLLTRGTLRPEEDGRSLSRFLVEQVHLLPASLAGDAREMVMAPVLDQRLSPRAMLELYLNRVYLGEEQGYPVFGIHHAAREYFDKTPRELTLGEAATLAGLLLSPRIENPEAHVGAVGARRAEVLEVLLEGELITVEDYRRALSEPLGFQPGLDQMPFSRPAEWGREEQSVIRLPPELRPAPTDSAGATAG